MKNVLLLLLTLALSACASPDGPLEKGTNVLAGSALLAATIAASFAEDPEPSSLDPVAATGSKADGTVTVSYEYYGFEDPGLDEFEAENIAKERCRLWNYKTADAFSKGRPTCLGHNQSGECIHTRVDTVYQCTGDLIEKSK